MKLYFLFAVFLYIEGSNARVVPLSFTFDESKHEELSVSENELIGESPQGEVEILGHSVPGIGKSNDSESLIFDDKKTSVLEISSRNSSDLSVVLASDRKTSDEESSSENGRSSEIANFSDNKSNLSSEFTSNNNSDSKESSETIQVNSILNGTSTEHLTFENEAVFANNSLHDLDQENHVEFAEAEEKSADHFTFENETVIANNSLYNLDQEKHIEFSEAKEKSLNDTMEHRNETYANIEVFNGTNSSESFLQLQKLANDTEINLFPSDFENITEEFGSNLSLQLQPTSNNSQIDAFRSDAENITKEFKLSNLSLQLNPIPNNPEIEFTLNDVQNISEELMSNNSTRENLNKVNDSTNTGGGIFSGFDFLINSEVARNAAKAMEVFNFSDPLTDHIMEENEFHSFLPEFHSEQIFDSTIQTDTKTGVSFTSSSGEESSQLFHQAELEKSSSLLNQTKSENLSTPFNLTKGLEARNETEFISLPETSEISASLGNQEGTNELASEVPTSNEIVNGSASNSSTIVSECPPPGWCIFWFLSQDTCAINDHCLGSRICCQIRCSKTCIEVE